MPDFTRKQFLFGAAVTGAALAASAARATSARPTVPARPRGPARPVLIKGADILTMDDRLGERPATDLLVREGRIAAIGKDLAADGAETVDASGMILMPGMHDGHRHLWHAIGMGSLVSMRLKGLDSYQRWKMPVMASMTPDDHHLVSLIGGLQAIDAGVTTIIDQANAHFSQDRVEAAAQGILDSGVSGWFAYQMGVSASYRPGQTVTVEQANADRLGVTTPAHWAAAEYLAKTMFRGGDAAMKLALSPVSKPDLPMTVVKREYDRARALGVELVDIHIHKPRKPSPEGHQGYRGSGIRDFHDAGLLGPDFHIGHGTQLDLEELHLMRDSGAMICATPMGEITYAGWGGGAPVHGRAREAGVAVGIGIDLVLSLTQDYFEQVRTAYWSLFIEEEGRRIASGYTSTDALDFATRLGAKSAKLGDVTGTLSVGKRADLVLVRTDRIGFAMQGSLADRIVNFAALEDIDSVWVGGTARKRHGRMIDVDWVQLKGRLAEAQERVRRTADTIRFL
jgi:cytosine/adenosine deaminase-related metal-dependent hydrolase